MHRFHIATAAEVDFTHVPSRTPFNTETVSTVRAYTSDVIIFEKSTWKKKIILARCFAQTPEKEKKPLIFVYDRRRSSRNYNAREFHHKRNPRVILLSSGGTLQLFTINPRGFENPSSVSLYHGDRPLWLVAENEVRSLRDRIQVF